MVTYKTVWQRKMSAIDISLIWNIFQPRPQSIIIFQSKSLLSTVVLNKKVCCIFIIFFPFFYRKRRKLRIRQAAATKEHQAVVNAVGRFMKVHSER